MLNRKQYPFKRNAYYFGKPQMSRDHEMEQQYHNNKRRLQNRLTGGHGIVAGLGVVMADDASIILQAGEAIDAGGREIVVPETKVIKLSTVDGYDALESDCAYLSLAYAETPTDEVFPAMRQGESEETQFNHIVEGYRLALLDEALVQPIAGSLDEFVNRQVLYSDEEIRIVQSVPRYAVQGSDLRIHVRIEKTGHGLGEYAFRYDLSAPDFSIEDGEANFQVAASGLKLTHGQSESLSFRIVPQAHVWSGKELVITASNLLVQKNDESFPINDSWPAALRPVEMDITDWYLKAWYDKAMDKLLDDSHDDRLWIARIELIRQKNAVMITGVAPPPFAQYSYNAQQLMALRHLERYYPAVGSGGAARAAGDAAVTPTARPAESFDLSRIAASGVFDLGLGLGYNTKEAIYSEEIMHGLGKGPVYVEIGVEYLTMNGAREAENSEIYLGDLSVFEQEENRGPDERIYKVSTAVKVLAERGTFIVGVLPRETSGLVSLRIRWFAMRMGEVNKQIRAAGEDRYIVISPDTIKVAPKGTAHIKPAFVGMQAEACNFKVMDEDGGSIDHNGMYTAPAKEGVYEIRVEAISDPSVYACAFAMVSQKKD